MQKRRGRPKKKAFKGISVKTYRNKRKYLQKITRGQASASLIPSLPKVISAGSIRKLDKAREKINIQNEYYRLRDELEKYVVILGLPKIPEHITRASIKKLERLLEKVRAKKRKDQGLPDIPELPDLPEQPEEPEEPPTDLFDEIIDDYLGYVDNAHDSGYTFSKFISYNQWTRKEGAKSQRYIERQISYHATEIENELKNMGAKGTVYQKQKLALALIKEHTDIFEGTEKALYFYQCVFQDDTFITTFQEVEKIINSVKNITMSQKDSEDWQDLLDEAGVSWSMYA